MSKFYHDGSRELQDRFDTRRLADRIEQRLIGTRIGDEDKAFIESLDMFFLATSDADNQPSCSYKGGEPGFVRVVDPGTIAFPTYDGNGMFLSMGNLAQNRRVGMLFIDFLRPKRLRISGEATIHLDDPLLPAYPEAQFVVRVAVTQVFFRTARAMSTSTRWSSARASCRSRVAQRPFRTGKGATGRKTSCRKTIRRGSRAGFIRPQRSRLALPRIERVAQTVAQQVEGQH